MEQTIDQSRNYSGNELKNRLNHIDEGLILSIYERSQFKLNPSVYEMKWIGSSNVSTCDYFPSTNNKVTSFLDFLLQGTEELHSRAGRFLHPEEHPFTKYLPKPVIERQNQESPLRYNNINLNNIIKNEYFASLGKFCEQGDDGHYGSTAVCDIKSLQYLSKRIHYGKFLAEDQLQRFPEIFLPLIESKDIISIEKSVDNKDQRRRYLERIKEKAKKYSLEHGRVRDFYNKTIIPLTNRVMTDYLSGREK